jgi:hypothetical protein
MTWVRPSKRSRVVVAGSGVGVSTPQAAPKVPTVPPPMVPSWLKRVTLEGPLSQSTLITPPGRLRWPAGTSWPLSMFNSVTYVTLLTTA